MGHQQRPRPDQPGQGHSHWQQDSGGAQGAALRPFTGEELKKIFNPEAYATYGTKPHLHWLPYLLLHTGARPDELASMRLDNVRKEKGINYCAITAGKTTSSLRKVAFHKAILASGFMAYVAQRRKDEPGGMLFPDLNLTKNGYVKNVSRRFNEQHLRDVRIDLPTKRLYSFAVRSSAA